LVAIQRKVLNVKRTSAPLIALALVFLCLCVRAAAQSQIRIIRPSHDVVVPDAILQKFSTADIQVLAALPSGKALIYDTVPNRDNADDLMDSHPHIALLSRTGAIVLDVDVISLAPTGHVGFDGMAVLPISSNAPLLVCAFTLGVDGSGTFFVFVGQDSGNYKVVGSLTGAQAQIRFSEKSPHRFELWTADAQSNRNPDQQCVRCPKYYRTRVYEWQNGKLALISEAKSNRGYDPETFDNTRFLVK